MTRPSSNLSLPKVLVLGTGGTIAASGSVATQLSDYSVGTSVDALIQAVPELKQLARFDFEQIANIKSFLIGDEVLLKLAHRVNVGLADPDVRAVVITHGTDTLEETAYFLNLVVNSDKPVVLVGAMRPATALSADGPLNLFHAVSVAVHPDSVGKGVIVVMNDRMVSARHVSKHNTTFVDTFNLTEQGCLGTVSGVAVGYDAAPVQRHTVQSELHLSPSVKNLPAVDIIYEHQGAGLHLYQASIASGARGIVLAGTGNGSMSDVAIAAAELAAAAGIAFVRSTRVGQGRVGVSINDKSHGTVAAQSLNPQKARILLRLALLKTNDREVLQRIFNEY